MKLQVQPLVVSLQLHAKKTKRASKWQEYWNKLKNNRHEAEQEGCFICTLHAFVHGSDFSGSICIHEVKWHVATKRHTELAKAGAGRGGGVLQK